MTTPLEEVLASSHPRPNPCLEPHLEEGSFFIECLSSDNLLHGFPYAHLLNYRIEANPELERSPSAPPERLSLWFSTHQVLILGWHLDSLRYYLRKGAGITLKPLDPRYQNLQPKECFISEVTVLPAEK